MTCSNWNSAGKPRQQQLRSDSDRQSNVSQTVGWITTNNAIQFSDSNINEGG